jgi:hypothetical protein
MNFLSPLIFLLSTKNLNNVLVLEEELTMLF